MRLLRAYKTELDPNDRQRTLLAKAVGCARFAWNWGLARRIEEYKRTGKSSNAIEQHKQLNALKKTEFPWMYEVSKCAPQAALQNLDKAYENFYRRVKAGEKPGFPKFKSRHRAEQSFGISFGVEVAEDKVWLPRIGWVPLKESGYLPVKGALGVRQFSATISKVAGRWFVSVQCEVETPDITPQPVLRTVGIDVGLKDFAVTSDGEHVGHPKFLKKMLRKLRRLQRKVSRRQKRGTNRKKAVRQVGQQHYKISCQRKDFLHKLTTNLVKTKPEAKFVVEDLCVKGMMGNQKLSRGIGDSGWSEFVRQLQYKAGDDRVVKADKWFPSSKLCSHCGVVRETLTLAERTFECPACGYTQDRDENAAVNLSKYEQLVAGGVYRPRPRRELPPVRREVTPVESGDSGRRQRCSVPLSEAGTKRFGTYRAVLAVR